MTEYYTIDNQDELIEFCNEKNIKFWKTIDSPVTIALNQKEITAVYSKFVEDAIDYTEHMKLKKLREILA